MHLTYTFTPKVYRVCAKKSLGMKCLGLLVTGPERAMHLHLWCMCKEDAGVYCFAQQMVWVLGTGQANTLRHALRAYEVWVQNIGLIPYSVRFAQYKISWNYTSRLLG